MPPKEKSRKKSKPSPPKDSEKVWLKMTDAAPDEADRWSNVEEDLVDKTQQHDHSERRWKYFSK